MKFGKIYFFPSFVCRIHISTCLFFNFELNLLLTLIVRFIILLHDSDGVQ